MDGRRKDGEAPTLVVVEDGDSFRETLLLEFADRGYDVHGVRSVAELRAFLARRREVAVRPWPRFAIVDLRLGRDDGLTALGVLLDKEPEVRAVVLTGYASLATAVEAVKRGAVNYLTKPVDMARLERALWTDEPDPEEIAVPEKGETLARREREYIEYVLLQCDGNISRAARWLGIHRQSLQRKLRKFTPR